MTVPGTGRCGAATGWLSPYAFAEQSPILSCGMPQGSLVLSYDMLYWVREVLSDGMLLTLRPVLSYGIPPSTFGTHL